MISRAVEAEILRLYHAESWPIGTIARQLHIHHTTVRRVLWQSGVVMVLSYSRHLFLRFYLNASSGSFLDVHVQAFAYFTAVPRVCLYDNLRSAVPERSGDAIRFNHQGSLANCID